MRLRYALPHQAGYPAFCLPVMLLEVSVGPKGKRRVGSNQRVGAVKIAILRLCAFNRY